MATVLRLTFDKDTATDGWGTFRPDKLAAQMRAYAAVGQLKQSLRVEDVFTMKILQRTAASRPKRG
jgi:NitT/TauT family transport system substrate-binding protein